MGKSRRRQRRQPHDRFLTALVADRDGQIVELEGFAAVGMDGPLMEPLSLASTMPTPHGSEVMWLPDRRPIVFDMETRQFVELEEDPYRTGSPVYPVAAFNSPGYVTTHVPAYRETSAAAVLPLFSYGAIGWHGDGFRSTLIQVDTEPRQDLRFMDPSDVERGIRRLRRELPGNRLRAHLEKCALTYGCPAGKNFFLGRYEAPLPTSRRCNARCLGCLSFQENSLIRSSQDRIDFTPTPDEIAGVALAHIGRVPGGVVSFGQGCEGDPLLAAHVIEPAIRRIRQGSRLGTINLNTNASRPDVVASLFEAGLDSMRVSMNSVREACYNAYFQPNGYGFADVLASIDRATATGGMVSLNYLNQPGVTDTPEEREALLRFLDRHPVQMIQWRNLNYDPVRYRDAMMAAAPLGTPIGMAKVLNDIRNRHPTLLFGYFNPTREILASALGGRGPHRSDEERRAAPPKERPVDNR
jgi:pyruvate-formate lyase-activating enzyme